MCDGQLCEMDSWCASDDCVNTQCSVNYHYYDYQGRIGDFFWLYIGLGALVLIGIVVAIICCCLKKKKNRNNSKFVGKTVYG